MVPGPVRPALRAGTLVCFVTTLAACAESAGPTAPDEPLEPALQNLLVAHLVDPFLLDRLPGRLSAPAAAAPLRAALGRLPAALAAGGEGALRRAIDEALASARAYAEATGPPPADAISLAAIELSLEQGRSLVDGEVGLLPSGPALLSRQR